MLKKITALTVAAFLLCAPVFADLIVLKDDQQFSADVKNFDAYYLNVLLSSGTPLAIPWNEVRLIKHTTTGSSWLEETYITKEDAEVNSLVVPLDENTGLQKAFFPGFIMHGAGQFYAKNQNMGMSLLSAEIVSVIIMGISLNEVLGPNDQGDSLNVSRIVFFSGLTMFAASWLWDVFTAKCAVSDYNSSHKFLIDEAKSEAASVTATAAAGGPVTGTATDAVPTAVTATSAPAEKTKGESK
jgi:hypothetical protein